MKKLESNFRNMVLVLSLISAFAAGALGLVNEITKEPIRLADLKLQEEAVRAVTPAFDNAPLQERYSLLSPEGDSLDCYPARRKNEVVGVAVRSYSLKGFSGRVDVMVGLKPDGSINDYAVVKHHETPGLGSRMQEWFRQPTGKHNVLGLNPGKDKVWVSKDGGDVDGITAATISSRAFLDAVDRAYRAYMQSLNVNLDARTGASSVSGGKPSDSSDTTTIRPGEQANMASIAQKATPVLKTAATTAKKTPGKTQTVKQSAGEQPETSRQEEVDGQSAASQHYSTNEGEE